jgi:uncharacterized membrane protein
MSRTATRTLLLLAVTALVGLSPAAAQLPPFSAEVDCDGIFAPGDTVPYTLRLENQTLEPIPLDLTIELFVPGRGTRTLKSGSLTLGANQDRQKTFTVRLPAGAPLSNDYEVIVTADSADETSFDTCSFKVQ